MSRADPAPPSCPPRGPTLPGRRVVIVIAVAAFAVAAAVSAVAFAYRYNKNQPPPVGAGAGHTGMYNEYGGIGKQKAP